jgi:hypothetical protein
MSTVLARSIARLTRNLAKAIMGRWEGPFPTSEYVSLLAADLKQYDLNRSDFVWDIARKFVAADLAERAKVDPFKLNKDGKLDPALFVAADFAKGVIRLGDGKNSPMATSTSRHWIARQLHQQRAAEDSQRAATRTTMFLQTEPGVMLVENPRLRTLDAMCELKLWTPDQVHEAEDDDDDEESND